MGRVKEMWLGSAGAGLCGDAVFSDPISDALADKGVSS